MAPRSLITRWRFVLLLIAHLCCCYPPSVGGLQPVDASLQQAVDALVDQNRQLQSVIAQLRQDFVALRRRHDELLEEEEAAEAVMRSLPSALDTSGDVEDVARALNQRRSLLSSTTSTADVCAMSSSEDGDAVFAVDGAIMFTEDVLIGDGAESFVEAAAELETAEALLDNLRCWECYPLHSATVAVGFQRIATQGGAGMAAFSINGSYFLVIANFDSDVEYGGLTFVYRFDAEEDQFELFQEIPADGAMAIEHFTIGADAFLAVAIQYSSSYFEDSLILRYNTSTAQFEVFQEIPTFGASGCAHFDIDGVPFLAIASYFGVDAPYNDISPVYRYNSTSLQFEWFQNLTAFGGFDVEPFTINGTQFLATTNTFNGTSADLVSTVYSFDNTSNQFTPFQKIDTSWAIDWEHFVIDEEHFLALATFADTSVVYRFNESSTRFETFQEINVTWANHLEFFELGDNFFLAFAVHSANGGYDTTSPIFRYSRESSAFKPIQGLSTEGAWDVQHMDVDGTNFLAITNHCNDSTCVLDSSIYQLNSFCFT